jgi:tol-pal system protein YbgF
MKAVLLGVLALMPIAAFGQSQKDMIREVQRDVALLQDQVRQLQQAQTSQLSELRALVQQAIDAANKANTSVAVLQSNFENIVGSQFKSVGQSTASVSSKVDQLTEEFRSVRESMADVNGKLSKLDAKVTDLTNAVTTIRNPPAAPGTMPPGATGSSESGPPPGASAEASYQSAVRDMQSGNLDLALQEFTDYLKWFPQTDYAPNAQYYIGDIYYRKGDLDKAISGFDAVLERFPENPKTADARYMKGLALVQAGKPTAASKEFKEIIQKYPGTDQAAKAKSQLRALGVSTSRTPATKRHK